MNRWIGVVALGLLATACGGDEAQSPSTTAVTFATVPSTTTTTTEVVATEPPSVSCDAPAYLPTVLPDRAVPERPDPAEVPIDRFTAIPETGTAIWLDGAGAPVVVVVRGALPPADWAGETEVIEILGDIPAQLGPLEGGHWGVAWAFQRDDQCSWYSLIVYPPTDIDEVRALAAGLG